jgi:KaiC/GvpD/RAD55 family RecA-like ATPase
MKVVLDSVTLHKGKPVVYAQIQDDDGKVIETFSAYYTDKESFEKEVRAKISAYESKSAAKITTVTSEIQSVFAAITAEKKGA